MFRPKKSKSFENYFCNKNSDCVISDVDTSVMNCSDYYHGSKLCNFTYSYADGFTANGFLVKETVDSHPAILLGCTTLLDSTGAQGLMGMNLGSLSFPTQAGITKFSYCISSNSSRGKFYLGTNPYDGFRYLNLLEISPGIPTLDSLAYTVLLNCIRFSNNNTQIQVKASDPMIDESDSNGIMIDSATQYSFLLPNTYADLREKVDNLTKGFNMTGVDYSQAFDMCYPVGTDPNAVAAAIGDLVFDFGSKVTITVPKERVLDRINDKTCVAIGKSALLSSMTGVHTLGISYQKCHWVEYDSYNRRVGFREIGPSREHQNITCG